MTKQQAKNIIDEKIVEYTTYLNHPFGKGYEKQINGIIQGLKEAKKIVSKITKI